MASRGGHGVVTAPAAPPCEGLDCEHDAAGWCALPGGKAAGACDDPHPLPPNPVHPATRSAKPPPPRTPPPKDQFRLNVHPEDDVSTLHPVRDLLLLLSLLLFSRRVCVWLLFGQCPG